ncbi:uncharacterized protein LOC128554306 [Mercenaria mercenaria]|uniref:uncharacterized protein LOC128554306 n=1 Tax=Mercenaria mercenaria TaxID=6596 RepID=UPI00234ED012|nr:uncharacterized protein LOC128554306 [Mercenaria mercenaria]
MASAKENRNSDEKLEIFCDPCQVEKEYILAVCFCEECNVYLCRNCNKVHKRLASTREHVVKEETDLPEKTSPEASKTDLPEKCLSHGDQVIDHYCISHEELCCSMCLSKSHHNCEDVRNIHDYLKDFDMDQEQTNLEGKMRGLADDIDITQYLVQTSLKAVELNHEVAQAEMLKVKQAAFEHIEGIHDTLKKELNETREKDTKKVIPYKNKCDAITFDIHAMKSYLKAKKKDKYRSFVAMKKAGLKIKSNRDDLKELKLKKYLKVRRYCFQPDADMDSLKYEPYSFGKLNDQNNAIKSTSLVASLHAKDVDEENSFCCFTGLAVLNTNCIVVADHGNMSVKLVDVEEDKILSRLKLTTAPWDVTVISDKQIAVTIPEIKTVHFVSITGGNTLDKQEKQISLSGKCYGVTNSHDTIIVTLCEPTPKYEQYNLDGTLLHSIQLDARNPQYVSLNADKTKMYISDNYNQKYIQEISVTEQRKVDTLRVQNVTGMAIDKTDVLYYLVSSISPIYAVCIDKMQDRQRQSFSLISDSIGRKKCLAYCDETNRLFVGIQGEEYAVQVYYVV